MTGNSNLSINVMTVSTISDAKPYTQLVTEQSLGLPDRCSVTTPVVLSTAGGREKEAGRLKRNSLVPERVSAD